jgi:beta-glucosidase
MVMLPYDYKPFTRNMISAVGRGEIQESRIDDAVRRILKAKFALGLFERDTEDASAEVIGSQTHRALAREAVAKSLVLLKNEGNILPIRNDVDHIRITGSAADNVGRQAGAWTFEWQGIDGNWLSGATSILSGIREVAKENVRIEYDMNGFFAESEPRADLGIAIVGEAPYAEGHGDNADPSLSVEDVATITRLKEASDRVVVVLVTGRPLLIADQQDDWNALIVAWLPGSEGTGVADVLFGAVPVTGKLPLPWPSSLTQLPISSTGATRDGTPVLFPRNFGLSYYR